MPNHGTIPKEDWDHRLYRLLIDAGTDGLAQVRILHFLQAQTNAANIRAKLEAWYAEDKVQKFEEKTKGRPRIVWRATKLLLTEYDPRTDPDPPVEYHSDDDV